MKAVLGALLCFVLVQSECFALKGGPPWPGGSVNLAGTYAGVLQPAFDPTDPSSSNSIGVFTLGVPNDGASTGSLLIFSAGRVFGGSVQGIVDPKQSTLSAIMTATFTYVLSEIVDPTTGTVVERTVTTSINGPLNGKLIPNRSFISASNISLQGSATGFVSNGEVDNSGNLVIVSTISFDVMGFRQSSVAPAAGTLIPPSP